MKNETIFESIKHVTDNGVDYWSARELLEALDYAKWQKFLNVIEKAKQACHNSGQEIENHFLDADKIISIGSSTKRPISDLHLTRYACYLVVQNANPSKEVVALGQTYFANQTRKQELLENEYENLDTEEDRRIFLRKEMTKHNKNLAQTAKKAGVSSPLEYAVFQNFGYKGLYGGLDAKGIHSKKELKKSQNILDHMGSTELAANLFRATQTEEKLKREKIDTKQAANQTHFQVGKKVRQTIEEIGGEMPENLPTANSIKKLEREQNKKNENKK